MSSILFRHFDPHNFENEMSFCRTGEVIYDLFGAFYKKIIYFKSSVAVCPTRARIFMQADSSKFFPAFCFLETILIYMGIGN
jgi:hypothetical protein